MSTRLPPDHTHKVTKRGAEAKTRSRKRDERRAEAKTDQETKTKQAFQVPKSENTTHSDFLDHRNIHIPRRLLHEGLIRKVQIRSVRATKGSPLDITVDFMPDRYLILLNVIISLSNFNCIIWFINLNQTNHVRNHAQQHIHDAQLRIKHSMGEGGRCTRGT